VSPPKGRAAQPSALQWSDVVEELINDRERGLREMPLPRVSDDMRRRLQEIEHESNDWYAKVLRSPAMEKALAGLAPMSIGNARACALEIAGFLHAVRIITVDAGAGAAERYVERLRSYRARNAEAQELLKAAAALVADHHAEKIKTLISEIATDPFALTGHEVIAFETDPALLGQRGVAARDSAGAFRGWMVKELSRRVPNSAPKRSTAIAELVAFAGVETSAQSVARILKMMASKQ
jgi:hypothetical protein